MVIVQTIVGEAVNISVVCQKILNQLTDHYVNIAKVNIANPSTMKIDLLLFENTNNLD